MTIQADPDVAARYRAKGWWGQETLSDRLAELARTRPNDVAYVTHTPLGQTAMTWGRYHEVSASLAALLVGLRLGPRARVAVILPDGPTVHAALVAVERAGLVAVGIGARAGDREIAHLMRLTGASALITHGELKGRSAEALRTVLTEAGITFDHLLVVPDLTVVDDRVVIDGVAHDWPAPATVTDAVRLGPDELFLLNSTSGTTGLPKCVTHTQNRWFYFHQLAAEVGNFGDDEVLMGAVPAPFGFGLWTAHFTPMLLGCQTILLERFNADATLDLIEQHRVTVLCCVSTQFIMMLNAQAERPRDLSSLRSMFTGGEAVPYERAAEFEETTGAKVLQFYGSNETGALSATTVTDTRERRLRTAGRILDDMEVRLFDPATGVEILERNVPGQPGCRGPATCLGYWGDEAANAKLYTSDGWMLMGDIVEIDTEGYLRVVGRTSDFIIRGGKNISAPAVEEEVGTHPAVAMVAAVAMPDPVFGERVCVYVVARAGMSVSLEDIIGHLAQRGVSREWFPEHLVLVDALPRSSGGKVAKGDLRADLQRRLL